MERNSWIVAVPLIIAACIPAERPDAPERAVRAPLVQLPFVRGTSHQCTQGVESDHEHVGPDRYGVDFAAARAGEDVVAPVAGTAYRHGSARYGRHVNIDLGDGRYVTVGFLSSVTVDDGDGVAVGQVIGRAGIAHGAHPGVHAALYRGDAEESAGSGEPLPFTRLMTRDRSMGRAFAEHGAVELVCGRTGDPLPGHLYEAATIVALRHLPGTLIKTADDVDVYLVRGNGTRARIANETVFRGSGFTDGQVVIVSEEELDCYGVAKEVTKAISAPPPPRLRDGTLVKEAGRPASYAVSGGIAWPIRYWEVFLLAGYDPAQVVEIPPGTLVGRVEAIGDCETADHCLDAEYLGVCANAPDDADPPPPAPAPPPIVEAAPDGGVPPPETAPDVSPAPDLAPDAAAADTAVPPSPPDAGTAPDITPSPPPLPTWVWAAEGSKLCLNARYFVPASAKRAALHLWSGPWVTGTNGPVASKAMDRFCWDFAFKPAGTYRFWSDVPHVECALDEWCRSDGVGGNGALYYEAPMATAAERRWLACQSSGCDGMGRWDGASWEPTGNQ